MHKGIVIIWAKGFAVATFSVMLFHPEQEIFCFNLPNCTLIDCYILVTVFTAVLMIIPYNGFIVDFRMLS